MVKEPRPGRVKSRLARDIGAVDAAWWFRREAASAVRRLSGPRWRTVLAVSPDREGLSSRVWPERLPRMPQGPGDLGERMARIFRSIRPGPVVIVGADIPDARRTHIADAFASLGTAPSVVGPAEDGGYWLVGLRHGGRVPSGIFEGVRWSSAYALADTLPTLPHPVARIATLRDVDTVADLAYLRRRRIS